MMTAQRANKLNQEVVRLQAENIQLCQQKQHLEREYEMAMDRYLEGADGNIRKYQTKMNNEIKKCQDRYNKNMARINNIQLQLSRG